MTKYKVGDRVVVGDKLRCFKLKTLGTVVGFKERITFDIRNLLAVVRLDETNTVVEINEDWLDPIPARWLLS